MGKKMITTLRTTSALALAAAALAAPASAQLLYENQSGGSVRLYGQFNPALISVDDGQQTETQIRDNDLSRSRIGLRLAQPFGDNTFRFRFEAGLGLPNSTETNQLGDNFSGWTRDDLRHIDFSLEGDWGKVSLGQGSMAADGIAESDLSYVGVALYSYLADANAGFFFRDTAGVLSGPAVGDALDTFDGSRRGRIRYDSPEIAGFTFSAAYGENILNTADQSDYYDAAVRYSGEFAGGVQLDAGLAYQVRDNNGVDRSDVVGSASVLLKNGLSFTFAGGTRDNDAAGATDPDYLYFKVAYDVDLFSFGKTGVGVHYYDGSDFNVAGSETKGWGVGIAQRVEAYNTDVYFTYQDYEYDDAANSYQDLSTIVLGARWRF
ncbi:porin [Ruegeria pomeroyi]|nr:porin [Ruegeria pomeroyi]